MKFLNTLPPNSLRYHIHALIRLKPNRRMAGVTNKHACRIFSFQIIYIPEIEFSEKLFLNDVRLTDTPKNRAVVFNK